MEADLARYYGSTVLEYHGGRMSLWQLAARVRHLPVESACNAALGGDGTSNVEYLLYDLISATIGEPHPDDPRHLREKRRRAEELRAAKAQSDARRERLGIKGSVLRKAS